MAHGKAWKAMTVQEKVAALQQQLRDIQKAQVVLDNFHSLTLDWLAKLETVNQRRSR